MRVALARALFVRPTLLLLDEPTNHLDLEACVWLEEYLKTYDKCLIIISHSQDFLNGVCTHIIWLTKNKLTYYTGNYDTFCKTVAENEVIQQKKYEKEQEDIKHIKQFIASCGTSLRWIPASLAYQGAAHSCCATALHTIAPVAYDAGRRCSGCTALHMIPPFSLAQRRRSRCSTPTVPTQVPSPTSSNRPNPSRRSSTRCTPTG
jgi:hypothetical protein